MWPYRARQGGWGESSRRIFGDFWGNAPLVEVHQLKNQLSQKEFRHKAVIDWANAYLFENTCSGSFGFLFFYQLVAKLCSCYQKISLMGLSSSTNYWLLNYAHVCFQIVTFQRKRRFLIKCATLASPHCLSDLNTIMPGCWLMRSATCLDWASMDILPVALANGTQFQMLMSCSLR